VALVNSHYLTITNCFDNSTHTELHWTGNCESYTFNPKGSNIIKRYLIIGSDDVKFYYFSDCRDKKDNFNPGPDVVLYDQCVSRDNVYVKYHVMAQNGVGFIVWIIINGLAILGVFIVMILMCCKR